MNYKAVAATAALALSIASPAFADLSDQFQNQQVQEAAKDKQDKDYCWRIWNAGKWVIYNPSHDNPGIVTTWDRRVMTRWALLYGEIYEAKMKDAARYEGISRENCREVVHIGTLNKEMKKKVWNLGFDAILTWVHKLEEGELVKYRVYSAGRGAGKIQRRVYGTPIKWVYNRFHADCMEEKNDFEYCVKAVADSMGLKTKPQEEWN